MLPFEEKYIILLGYRGSFAHGTYVEGHIDDIDILGLTMTPKKYVFGLKNFEQKEIKENKYDVLIYNFRKGIRLLLGNNPNVLSLLWLKDEHYLIRHPLGNILIANRDLFLSKELYYTFGGYARGQLHRMTAFQKYEGYMGEKEKELLTNMVMIRKMQVI